MLGFVAREKDHADRQVFDRVADAELRQLTREEHARDLRQHARAVAALAIGAHAAAMRHIADSGQRHTQNIVAHRTRKLRDKANATGIMLEARVV